MSVCSYLYASGLRIESGRATVDLDGKTYRVVRDGKGASRLDRPSTDPAADGEITLKDLQARLVEQGRSSIPVTTRTANGTFSVQLDPAAAMGRQGRRGDFAAALAAMPAHERRAAALHQLTTLPVSSKNDVKENQARLKAALSVIPPEVASRYLNAGFATVADDSTLMKVVAVSPLEDVFKLAATRCDSALLELARSGSYNNYEAREREKRQDAAERERLLSLGEDGIYRMILEGAFEAEGDEPLVKVLKLAPELVEDHELIGRLAVRDHLLETLVASPETVKRHFAADEAADLVWAEAIQGRATPTLYRALAQVTDEVHVTSRMHPFLLDHTADLLPYVADVVPDETIEFLWSHEKKRALVAKHAPQRLSQQQVNEFFAESSLDALAHLAQRLSSAQLHQATHLLGRPLPVALQRVAKHTPHILTDEQLAVLHANDSMFALEHAAELLSAEQIAECFKKNKSRTLERAPHLIPQALIDEAWNATWGADAEPHRGNRLDIAQKAFFRLDAEQRAWVFENMPDALVGRPAAGYLNHAQFETGMRESGMLAGSVKETLGARYRDRYEFYREALARAQ